MNKSIELDDELVRETQEATGDKTEREAVERVLKRFVEARRTHGDLLGLVGKIRFREDYDPSKIRFSRNDAN